MTTTEEAGRKGAQVRNEKYDHDERSEIAKKAAETRKEREGDDAFAKMGSQSHKNDTKEKGSRSRDEE